MSARARVTFQWYFHLFDNIFKFLKKNNLSLLLVVLDDVLIVFVEVTCIMFFVLFQQLNIFRFRPHCRNPKLAKMCYLVGQIALQQ